MQLSALRAVKGVTQWDLRIMTRINQSKISLIEHGYVIPSDKEKFLIAEALGIEVDKIEWPTEKESPQRQDI